MPRYIDVDRAIELIRNVRCKDCHSYGGVMCRACDIDTAIMYIDDFPAADVVPRAEVAREILKQVDELLDQHALGDIDDKELYYQFAGIKMRYKEETE